MMPATTGKLVLNTYCVFLFYSGRVERSSANGMPCLGVGPVCALQTIHQITYSGDNANHVLPFFYRKRKLRLGVIKSLA